MKKRDWAFLKLVRKCPLDGPAMTLLLLGLAPSLGLIKGLRSTGGRGLPNSGCRLPGAYHVGSLGKLLTVTEPCSSHCKMFCLKSWTSWIACTQQAITLCPSAFQKVLCTGPGLGLRAHGNLGPLRLRRP